MTQTIADFFYHPIRWQIQSSAASGPPVAPFTVDVTMDEEYAFESMVTSHPVEIGVDIVDHKRSRPIRLRMSGIVSDAADNTIDALAWIAEAVANPGSRTFGDDRTKHTQEAYLKLRSIYENTEPLKVVTQRQVFENMLVSSLTFKKNDAGFYIGFDMELIELQFATTDFVLTAPVAVNVAHTAPEKPKQVNHPKDTSGKKSYITKGFKAANGGKAFERVPGR